jgi:hypothetical protein
MEIITHDRQQDCNIQVDDSVYKKRLPRIENGLYLLSDGEEFPEQRLLDIEDPSRDAKKLEFNLRNFYIILMIDRAKKAFNLREDLVFKWNDRGVDDFEMDSVTDLGAFFAMAYEIVQDRPERKQFNLAFLLFHMENVKGRLCLDFSQDRMYRWFVDGIVENRGVANVLWKAIGLNPFASIKKKKRRLIREFVYIATENEEKRKAFNDILQRNCYGLLD